MNDNSECPWEPGEEYTTRGGHRSRIYCVDGGGLYPIHGATWDGVRWISQCWTIDGRWDATNCGPDDLMPPKRSHKWLDPAIVECGEGEFRGQRCIVAALRPHCRSVGFPRADLLHMLAMLDEAEGEA